MQIKVHYTKTLDKSVIKIILKNIKFCAGKISWFSVVVISASALALIIVEGYPAYTINLCFYTSTDSSSQ